MTRNEWMAYFDGWFCECPESWSDITAKIPSHDECEPKDIFWTDGDQILCINEDVADALADWIEENWANGDAPDCTTGYYDPDADYLDGTVDEYTGWWYVDA